MLHSRRELGCRPMSVSSENSSDHPVEIGPRSAADIFGSQDTRKPAYRNTPDAPENLTLSRQARFSRSRRRIQHVWLLLGLALVVADIAAVAFAPACTYWLRRGISAPVRAEALSLYVSSFIALISLIFCKAYGRAALRHPLRALRAVGLAWMWAGTVVFLAGLFSTASALGLSDSERASLLSYWTTSAGLVVLSHLFMTVVVAHLLAQGHLRERIVIVGADGDRSGKFVRHVTHNIGSETTILGLFDDRYSRKPDQVEANPLRGNVDTATAPICRRRVDRVEAYPVLGNTDSLAAYVRRNSVDRIVVSLPWSAEQRVTELITKLRQLPVRVDLLSHDLIWPIHSDISKIDGIPVVTVANQRVDAQLGLLKRIEDIIISSLFILFLTPVFVVAALAVKLSSPGPALFRQERYGFNNEIFNIYKFRSMYQNPDAASVPQASMHDPRITPLGRFLRRSSIDELPQFFNVLEGNMSLVGPRPHAVPHNIKYGGIIAGYDARHNVKPGITGWAQVNGHRGETDTAEKMRQRVECDLYYIEHWSVYFDLKVMILTAVKIWFQKSAY